MKTTMRAAVAVLMALLVSCGSACTGYQARQNGLLPAMRQEWAGEFGLRAMAGREAAKAEDPVAAAADVAVADKALDSGVSTAIAAAPWGHIDSLVVADITRRIAAGEISMGVGDSLRERLLQFQRSRTKLIQEVGQ